MAETGPRIKHISRDFKTGEVTETISGGEDGVLKVRHQTMEGGRMVTKIEGGGKLEIEQTPSEDPENLRPITQNQRGSYGGRR